MSIRKFGRKGSALANLRFSLLLNYLKNENYEEMKEGQRIKKISSSKVNSIINWVEFNIQPTPLSRVYKILIVYVEGYIPYAYVLSPFLNELKNKNPKIKDKLIPHLYDQNKCRLCLHYPHTYDYNSNEEIGQQYIPWIKLWLYYFEEWLFSEKWKGGGVEPGSEFDLEHNPHHNTDKEVKSNILSFKCSAIDISNKIYEDRLKKLLKGDFNG